MTIRKALPFAAAAMAVAFAAGGAEAEGAAHDAPISFPVAFHFHVDDGLAEQDVFVERNGAADKVFRPVATDQDLAQAIYAAASPVRHNPLDTEDIGPWQAGDPLGLTLGEWFAADGTGTYTCEGGDGHLTVDFTGLVPGGVYTMWHYFMAWPPTDPFTGTYDLPLGARDGSQADFVADTSGAARFDRTFSPCRRGPTRPSRPN